MVTVDCQQQPGLGLQASQSRVAAQSKHECYKAVNEHGHIMSASGNMNATTVSKLSMSDSLQLECSITYQWMCTGWFACCKKTETPTTVGIELYAETYEQEHLG